MLRITKVADYGFILLIEMAGDAGEMHNARDLARATHLPLPMVSKILKALVRGGLLTSHRGTKGGYSLSRSPELITAAEVITTLDGPITVTECLSQLPDHQCDYETRCTAKSSWQRLNEAISVALEGITLAEMAKRGGCCGGESKLKMQNEKQTLENTKLEAIGTGVGAG